MIKMSSVELNSEELRKELIEVYENFDEGNYSEEMIQQAWHLDEIYEMATGLVDDELGEAINYLTFAIQPQLEGAENKQEKIKKILMELKK